jgi:uncharacterized membrane-anchored protein
MRRADKARRIFFANLVVIFILAVNISIAKANY